MIQQELIKRHSEFLTLYDSEHDSAKPRTMSQLRKHVERSEAIAKKDENNDINLLIKHTREDRLDMVLEDYRKNQTNPNVLGRRHMEHYKKLIVDIKSRKAANRGSETPA
jgi:hypothetical protein